MAPHLIVGKVYCLKPLGPVPDVVVKVLEMRNDGWARVLQEYGGFVSSLTHSSCKGNGAPVTWADKQETWVNINAYAEIVGPYDK